MDIDCLETFLAVARSGSFTRAAEARHLTQPAVSRQVQRLEADLGVRLFEQTGRRVQLTAQGQLLLEEGGRLVGQIRGVRVALDDLGQLRRGELRVGASSTPGTYLIPRLLAAFRVEYPGVELKYELANSRAVARKVVQGDLELGFVGERIETGSTAIEAFAEDRICLVASPTHPLARRRSVTIEEVVEERYIAREDGSGTRRVFEQWLYGRERSWERYLELGSIEAVKQVVAAGLGVAAVSRVSVDWEVDAGRLAEVNVKGMQITRDLFLLHRREAPLSAAAAGFVALSKKHRFS